MEERSVPRLNTENYEVWTVRVKAHLMEKHCWEGVVGFADYIHVDAVGVEHVIDDETAFPQHEIREKKLNEQASAIIVKNVDNSFLDGIVDLETAKEMWEALEEVCSTYDEFQETIFLKEMANVEKTDCMQMIECCGVLAWTGLGRSGSRLSWPLPRTIGSVRVGSAPLHALVRSATAAFVCLSRRFAESRSSVPVHFSST